MEEQADLPAGRRWGFRLFAFVALLCLGVVALLQAPTTRAAPYPLAQPAGGLLTPTATPTCGLSWQIIPSPNTGVDSRLRAVTAISSTDAWAVGDFYSGNGKGAVAQHWDGTQWSVVPAPTSGQSTLNGVAAVSSNDVWAVGLDISTFQTLVMRWNGSAWSRVPSPGNGYLSAVSAVSPTDVWAVGGLYGTYSSALVLHWDGTTWGQVPTPSAGIQAAYLTGVSALAANDVWAVGTAYFTGASEWQTLVMRWNGATWSVVPSPNVGTGENRLNAVTAVAPNDAWAVGYYGPERARQALILRWNGSAWSQVTSPYAGTGDTYFWGVEGISASDAWAAGSFTSNDVARTFVAHWDGIAWRHVPSPNANADHHSLYGVAALSPNEIWAVGHHDSIARPLTMRYSGYPCPTATSTPTRTPTSTPATRTPTPACPSSWSIVPGPTLSHGYLRDIAAIAPDDAWAVGHDGLDNWRTLIEHWDGTQWSIVPSPSVGELSHWLNSVDAVAPDDIWAVGAYNARTLTMHWDGVQWSVVPSPNVSTRANNLEDVEAIAWNDVWAVGWSGPNFALQTLVLHWDGNTWSVVPSPNAASDNTLLAAAALSSSNVWAVGYYFNSTLDIYQVLIEHWDGAQWSIVAGPVTAHHSALYGVAGTSANDIWAVGADGDFGIEASTTLVVHWNGAAWSRVPSPNLGSYVNVLHAVTAISANDAWAVGRYNNGGPPSQTTTLHWNGATWSIVQSPNVGSTFHNLLGVAATLGNDVWAAGLYLAGSVYQSVALHYGPHACATPVPSRTRTPTPAYTATPTATPTPRCPGERFSDVCPGDYFYQAVINLSDRGVISGYADGTFRPFNNTTRAQLCKIVVLAEGWPINRQGGPHFRDVPADDTFYQFVETAYNSAIISGYSCGAACLEFRPGANATRGQVCKIVYNAVGP